MTNPDTCDESGGAVSLWYKVVDTGKLGVIVSTMEEFGSLGFVIYCKGLGQVG